MKLSIITVNLNDSVGLRKTLDSIFVKQNFKDFESIIIDGGSNDGSVDVILHYESHIAYWVSEKDAGIFNAMNKGIKIAKGDYLLFLNSGDYLTDDCLEKIFSKHIADDIIYGNMILVDAKGNFSLNKAKPYYTLFDFLFASLPHQASFIKRKLFDSYLYTEKYKICADWEFFLRKLILENCTTMYLDIPVCVFNTYGVTSLSKSQSIARTEREEVLNKYFSKRILNDYYNFKSLSMLNSKEISLLESNFTPPILERLYGK